MSRTMFPSRFRLAQFSEHPMRCPHFVYVPEQDAYRCPAGELLKNRFQTVERGLTLNRYWTSSCPSCSIKTQCTTSKERRVTRWEHEAVIETMQQRLDANPDAMRIRRQTVEHPFATLKARMGYTHFLTKTKPRVSTEMALHVLAYNLTRLLNIFGSKPILGAIAA